MMLSLFPLLPPALHAEDLVAKLRDSKLAEAVVIAVESDGGSLPLSKRVVEFLENLLEKIGDSMPRSSLI